MDSTDPTGMQLLLEAALRQKHAVASSQRVEPVRVEDALRRDNKNVYRRCACVFDAGAHTATATRRAVDADSVLANRCWLRKRSIIGHIKEVVHCSLDYSNE